MFQRRLFTLFALLLLATSAHADWAREQIGLYTTGPLDCSGVTIAYLDTGADLDSPFLQKALWHNPSPTRGDVHGYDFINQTGDVVDRDGHGTTISHVMAATLDDPNAVGICSQAQIMMLKISEGGSTTVKAIEQALDYAIEKKAKIVLMTTGLIMQSGLPPFSIKNRISRATRAGAIFIHAATNLSAVNMGLSHPRSLWPFLIPDRFHPIQGALSIGGSTAEDLPWLGGFRNRDKVHLAAPAQNVSVVSPDGQIQVINGNSVAAGMAAAMTAAYWTAHPQKSATDVVTALKASSHKDQAYLVDFQSGRMSLADLMEGVTHKPLRFNVAGQLPLEGGTAHPYDTPQRTEWEFSRPGAEYVRVVFSYINIGGCWDLQRQAKVTILDGHDRPVQEFVCENLARQYFLPSVFVKGDRLKVVFESSAAQNLYSPGFNFRFLEWASVETH